jgi:hypothetical protein
VLKVSAIRTNNGTIRDVLLSARDAMLPKQLARDPLAKWILTFDPLQSPLQERIPGKHHWSPSENSDGYYRGEIKLSTAAARDREPFLAVSRRGSAYYLLAHIAVEEAINFYFASLFHLGRILSSADVRLDAIQRLLDPVNLDASTARVHSVLDIDDTRIRKSLKEMCKSESEYQSTRRRSAVDCWVTWKAKVRRLQSLIVSSDAKSPPPMMSDVGAGLCFLVCSQDEDEFLETLGPDRALFRAVRLQSISRCLKTIASRHAEFTDALAADVYWKLVQDKLDSFDRVSALERREREKLIRREESSDRVFEKVWNRFEVVAKAADRLKPRSTRKDRLADVQLVIRKMTKLFLVDGSKPPIWQAARNEAKRAWIANSLHNAQVEAEFLINDFAEQLLRLSAEVAETPTTRFPFADSDWNAYVNSFFNTWWIPNLRHRLNKVGHEAFETLALAATRLLSTMGYSVQAATEIKLPPGAGEKHKSNHFQKPFGFS